MFYYNTFLEHIKIDFLILSSKLFHSRGAEDKSAQEQCFFNKEDLLTYKNLQKYATKYIIIIIYNICKAHYSQTNVL